MDKNIITIIVVGFGIVAPVSVMLLHRLLNNYEKKMTRCIKDIDKLFQLERDHIKDYHK